MSGYSSERVGILDLSPTERTNIFEAAVLSPKKFPFRHDKDRFLISGENNERKAISGPVASQEQNIFCQAAY